MPYPDNFLSFAYDLAWGRSKIMPRKLNEEEQRTLSTIATARQILIDARRDIRRLPPIAHEVEYNLEDTLHALRDISYSLARAEREVQHIPQAEADDANERQENGE